MNPLRLFAIYFFIVYNSLMIYLMIYNVYSTSELIVHVIIDTLLIFALRPFHRSVSPPAQTQRPHPIIGPEDDPDFIAYLRRQS